MLNSYLSDTALLLNDPSNTFYTTTTLTTLINRARRWLALRTLSVRALVTTLQTTNGQETYAITLANSAVSGLAGFSYPYGIMGISVAIGAGNNNYMLALGRKDFPSFNADDRLMNGTYVNNPVKFSTYGRGSTQVAYLFPVPSGTYNMWWDLACIPINLSSDTDTEAIPEPWTEIVPFIAAGYALATQQRWTDAQAMDTLSTNMMNEATKSETPFVRPSWYDPQR